MNSRHRKGRGNENVRSRDRGETKMFNVWLHVHTKRRNISSFASLIEGNFKFLIRKTCRNKLSAVYSSSGNPCSVLRSYVFPVRGIL
jgi:hypothetical protein